MNATKTVLVINDESATLTMFRLFLNAYGYSVLTAESGETGHGKKQTCGFEPGSVYKC